jgi:lipid-binding SYLF domain-containing protein
MLKLFFIMLSTLTVLTVSMAPRLSAQRNEAARVEDAIQVFQELSAVREKGIPAYMMKRAYAVAILPRVTKAALVVGGQFGKGILAVKNEDGSWGDPLFISFRGGSIGWQIGVQSIDLVLFFMTKKSVDGVLRGSFTLGVDVAVAAGALGRQAGAETDTNLSAEIYSYSRSRGLFAGVTLAGAHLETDLDADTSYYGRAVRPEDIMRGALPGAPPSAMDLKKALGK